MNRNALVFIALAVSIGFGAGFAAFGNDVPGSYSMLGGPLVALSWIAVGLLGRCDDAREQAPRAPSPVQDVIRR